MRALRRFVTAARTATKMCIRDSLVAVLTLAAMAGVLYPAAWVLYALCLAGGVWVLSLIHL